NLRDVRRFAVTRAGRVIAPQILVKVEHARLFDVGKDVHLPGAPAAAKGSDTGRQLAVGIVIRVHGDAELLEIGGTRHAVGRLADFLDRGQQQTDQHRDDGNDHQQFDEGKTPATDAHGSL